MKFSWALVLFLVFTTTALAQSPNKILSQAAKSLGGEKALRSVISSTQTGTITRISDNAIGSYRAETSTGNLYTVTYDIAGFETVAGYNGKSGWVRDSKNGLRTITGEAARDFQAEASYRNSRWLNAKSEKTKIASAGTTNIDGKTANAITLSTAKGTQIKLYFDSATGLLLREDIPAGSAVKTFQYADYRKVNNIQTPFLIKMTNGGETYEIKLNGVTYNQPIAKKNFNFPVVTNEPLPDIAALLNETRANAERIEQLLENYSFTELRVDREMTDKGELVEKSSEKRLLTFYKGYRINRLIEKNGKPLSPSDQADEDKDVQKQVADIEKRIAEREKKQDEKVRSGVAGQPSEENKRVTIADALKGSSLVNPRREKFRGRDIVVFDYEPNPAFKPESRMEKLFALCTATVFVDLATKQVVRLDATLTKSAGNFIAKAKRGASFSLENELVNDEIWLPSRADINLSVKILFAGININNLIKYADYRRFDTEIKDVKVGHDAVKP
jgi:hypothetical protein